MIRELIMSFYAAHKKADAEGNKGFIKKMIAILGWKAQ